MHVVFRSKNDSRLHGRVLNDRLRVLIKIESSIKILFRSLDDYECYRDDAMNGHVRLLQEFVFRIVYFDMT